MNNNKELRKKIREVYYDWANMPEFERIEKYPDDKRVEDSFMRIFHQEQTKLIEKIKDKLEKAKEENNKRNYNEEYEDGIDDAIDILKDLKKTL